MARIVSDWPHFEQCINDRTFWHPIALALFRHVRHHVFQTSQVCNLLANCGEMRDGERMHLSTGVSLSVDQMKQAAQLIEAEAKLSTSTNEVQPSDMI